MIVRTEERMNLVSNLATLSGSNAAWIGNLKKKKKKERERERIRTQFCFFISYMITLP